MPYERKHFSGGGGYQKAWLYEMTANKLRGVPAKDEVLKNGPAHYEQIWKAKEEQERQEEAERKRRSQARQAERERQARIKQQQELKRQQEELQREERARRWKHAQEETARKKAKLEKEKPPKKPKPKPKPKKLGDRASDNLQDEFGIGNGEPFDAHKVPINFYDVFTRATITGLKTYAEHTHEQEKLYRWAKKGRGPQNKTWWDTLVGNTEEDDPWKVCEPDKVKIAVEGLRKAGGNLISSLLVTKNPYLSSFSAVHGGLSGYMDEKEKQDVKIHECEKNKNPKL